MDSLRIIWIMNMDMDMDNTDNRIWTAEGNMYEQLRRIQTTEYGQLKRI